MVFHFRCAPLYVLLIQIAHWAMPVCAGMD